MTTLSVVGQSVTRRDLPEKLTGQAKYSADLKLPGMLYGHILRSPHPHANIVSIDTGAAAQVPGVLAIITPFDVPRRPVAPIAADTLPLDARVRFVGDEVAAVAAVDDDAARRALSLLRGGVRNPALLHRCGRGPWPPDAVANSSRRQPGD